MNKVRPLNQKPSRKATHKQAFSLTEISISITVIALIIAAIFAGSALITKARLTSARNATNTSPIALINGLQSWFETLMPDSTNSDFTLSEGNQRIVSWKDRNIQSGTSTPLSQTTDNLKPTLIENSINKLPSMKFDGDDEFSLNAASIANADYTIFFVGSQDVLKADHYFLGDPTATTGDNTRLLLGFDATGRIIHNQGGGQQQQTPQHKQLVPDKQQSLPSLKLAAVLHQVKKSTSMVEK